MNIFLERGDFIRKQILTKKFQGFVLIYWFNQTNLKTLNKTEISKQIKIFQNSDDEQATNSIQFWQKHELL